MIFRLPELFVFKGNEYCEYYGFGGGNKNAALGR